MEEIRKGKYKIEYPNECIQSSKFWITITNLKNLSSKFYYTNNDLKNLSESQIDDIYSKDSYSDINIYI